MIKRPLCIGAVLLILGLLIVRHPGMPKEASGMPDDPEMQVLGRVCFREVTEKGTRLYLNHFSILSPYETANASEGTRTVPVDETNRKDQLLVYLKKSSDETCSVGSWVVVSGMCKLPDTATNPGQFDARSYYFARKIVMLLQSARIVSCQEAAETPGELLTALREHLLVSYDSILGEEAKILSAITLGDRTGLSDDIKRLYQEGGIAHILAISSLHITLLGRGIYRLLRKRRHSFVTAGIWSAAVLVCYCVMTGRSVSAVRAGVMFVLWLGSQVAGRTNDSLTAAAVAAAIILGASPEYIGESSFLLSFGCILSLLCVRPVCERLLPVPGRIGKALQASAAIQIGTLPLIMYFFYQITPYAWLLNLLVLPCLSLVMATGMAGGVIGMISVPAGTLAAAPCHYLLRLFELLCRLERFLPGAVVITGRPSLVQLGLYYAALAVLCWYCRGAEQKRKSRIAGWLVLLALTGMLSYRVRPDLRITFLDVGQGDGILIEADRCAYLIDGGSSTVEDVWQYRVECAMKYYGISRLDAVFLSHGDQDHISGLKELLEGYETNAWGDNIGGITLKRLILPDTGYEDEKLEELAELAKGQDILTGYLEKGGTFASDHLRLFCLYPTRGRGTGDRNEDSMVLLLKYGKFQALFTGDLEQEGEQQFVRDCQAVQGTIDVLKVGHHGSKYATSRELLDVFRPKTAVISCGQNNGYGHPAQETLERLTAAGAKVYRTDQDGAVTIEVSRDGSWTVKKETDMQNIVQ